MSLPKIDYPCAVRRVRVRWRDGEWSIVKETVVPRMTLPKGQELPERQGRGLSGFWWEAADAAGRVLYRRVMPDPTEPRVEILDRDGSIRRHPIAAPEVTFDLLVPDLPEVAEVRIFSDREPRPAAPGEARRPVGAARQVATLAIRRYGSEGKPPGGRHGNR